MFYRISQFISAITAHITKEDRQFYKKYLSDKECELFQKLKIYDQKHSLNTAYLLSKNTQGDSYMIRLGLLHDIGKQVYPLNPVCKGLIVILDKITGGRIKKHTNIKMIKGYYFHAEYGYKILLENGNYDDQFLNIVRNHHNRHNTNLKIENKLIKLQKADDMS